MLVRAGSSNREMASAHGRERRRLFAAIFVLGAMLSARRRGAARTAVRRADRHGREHPDPRASWSSSSAASVRFAARSSARCWSAWSTPWAVPCCPTCCAAFCDRSRCAAGAGAGLDRHLRADGRDPVLASAGPVSGAGLTGGREPAARADLLRALPWLMLLLRGVSARRRLADQLFYVGLRHAAS